MKRIIEGKFIFVSGVEFTQVEYCDEQFIITRIGKNIGVADVVLTKDQFCFPSFIDIHCHCREDESQTLIHKETFKTATLAAINGGVSAIFDMPNNKIAPITEEKYLNKAKLLKDINVPVVLYGGINKNSVPFSFKAPYKFFMGPTTGTGENSSVEILEKYRGVSVSFHCEDPNYFTESKNHSSARPPKSEVESVKQAIALIEKYELHGIICHISTREGIDLCIAARERGVSIKVEATFHHLLLDNSTYEDIVYQVNPPLRSKEDTTYLIEQLKKGNIDYLVTDHAPHLYIEKLRGISGLPTLDTYALLVSELVNKHSVPLEIILKCAALNPGKFLEQFTDEKMGNISVGYQACFTVFDFSKKTKIYSKDLKTKCKWSPFDQHTFGSMVQLIGRFTHERFGLG